MSALDEVLEASAAIVEAGRAPGSMARLKRLDAALDELATYDVDLAVVLAASLWVDCYGRAGAPDYLAALEGAVRRRAEAAERCTDCGQLYAARVHRTIDGHAFARRAGASS